MFMCEGVRICFSFTKAAMWFAMNSSSRISPTDGRSQRIAKQSKLFGVRIPGGRQES